MVRCATDGSSGRRRRETPLQWWRATRRFRWDVTGDSPSAIDPELLAARIRAKRRSSNLSLRAAAKHLDISPATLSRVESGTHLPDRENLLKLARWAQVPLETGSRARTRDVHEPNASTLEAVELHLRADKRLAEDDAEMLVEILRTAYERLAREPR